MKFILTLGSILAGVMAIIAARAQEDTVQMERDILVKDQVLMEAYRVPELTPVPTPLSTPEPTMAPVPTEITPLNPEPILEPLHNEAIPEINASPEICSYSWHCGTVSMIISCESEWDPYAVGYSGERGLMQIHPVHLERINRMGYTWDDMFLPGPNIAVAYNIYSDSGWNPWTTRFGC